MTFKPKIKQPTEDEIRVFNIWDNDIQTFVEDCMPHCITAAIPQFHTEIYKLLQEKDRLLMTAPRGFAKSFICSVFYPLYCAIFKKYLKILIISASEDKAVEFIRMIKMEIENNKAIHAFFGDLRGTDKWTEGHIILANGVEIRAKGAGGQIRGYRPDLLILDDIETEESVATPEQRKKLRTWIFKACYNSLTPNGKFIWVGTVLTHLALICEYYDVNNGWEKRRYQAYIDGIEDEEHCLWKELWDHERLQKQKREIGSTFFACEYMNDPLADDAAPIKPHMIRHWSTLPEQMTAVIALDPAYSESERADAKVAVIIGVDQQGIRYLIDNIVTRESINTYIEMVIDMWRNHRNICNMIGIPNSGTEKSFFNSFRNECGRLRVSPPLFELKNVMVDASGVSRRKKEHRVIATLQPLFEQGRYFIHSNHTEAQEQLLSIGASRHDDVIDAMAYAEQMFNESGTHIEEGPQIDRYGGLIVEPNIYKSNGFDGLYGFND